MLRLIRVSVNAVHFAREHELRLRNRMSQGFWQRLGKQSFTRSPPPLPFPSLPGSSGWQQSQVKRTSGGNLNFGCSPRRRSDQWLSLLDLLPLCYIYEPGQLCLLRFSLISPRNIKKLILPILQCIAASKFLSFALTCSVSFSLAISLPLLKYQSQTPEIKSEEESAEGHSSQRAIKTFLAHSPVSRVSGLRGEAE